MNRNVGHLLKYFETQRDALEDLGRRVFRKPSQSNVHLLRIAARRSRAVLWILRHSSPQLSFEKLDRRLRKLGQALGAVRELDMAMKDAKKYNLDPAALKSKRKLKVKSLHWHLEEKRRRKLSREMAATIKAVRSQDNLNLIPVLETVREHVDRWQKRRLHRGARLHRFRIAIKKTRYTLEALGKPVEPLNGLQDLLGKVHDLKTLQIFLGKKRAVKRDQSTLAASAIRLAGPTLRRVDRQINSL